MESIIKLIIKVLSVVLDSLGRAKKREKDAVEVRKDPEITDTELQSPKERVALDLDVELNLVKAFIEVESGRYHKYQGKLVINYEAHYFKRLSGVVVLDSNVIKKDALNQQDEWRNFEAAKAKNEEAAYKSISMGLTQIMGANHRILGYSSAKEMFEAFNESSDNAVYGFGAFIKANKKLHQACKDKNYHLMAYHYNGPKYQQYKDNKGRTYADKIKETYERLCV